MKKLILSILAMVYLLAASGAAVELHYCMGKMVDWSFTHASSPSCDACGMEKQESGNHCCKDEQKYVKSVEDQKAGSGMQEFRPLVFEAEATTPHLPPSTFLTCGLPITHAPHGPPPDPGTAIFLRHRSLLL